MKTAFYSLVLSVCVFLAARGDLTIAYSTTVQPASRAQNAQASPGEAPPDAAAATNMTIKVKGDKARVDVSSPQVTTILDGTTGELINLLNDKKTVVRISGDKMKAIADMLDKFSNKKENPEKPRLTPTGQKEIINGYETEQYTYEGPDFKATYWIAPNYPNGANMLAQLQSIKSEFWDAANAKMPDFRDFPGLPIRMQIIVGDENHGEESHGKENRGKENHGNENRAKENQTREHSAVSGHPTEITSTVTGVSLESIPDSQFSVPADFKETKLPNIFNKAAVPSASPSP